MKALLHLDHIDGLNDAGGEHAGGSTIDERLDGGPHAGSSRLALLLVSHCCVSEIEKRV